MENPETLAKAVVSTSALLATGVFVVGPSSVGAVFFMLATRHLGAGWEWLLLVPPAMGVLFIASPFVSWSVFKGTRKTSLLPASHTRDQEN
jgi:energy-coupling factor transporter transmembrane protein EcfT